MLLPFREMFHILQTREMFRETFREIFCETFREIFSKMDAKQTKNFKKWPFVSQFRKTAINTFVKNLSLLLIKKWKQTGKRANLYVLIKRK
jgi:hypothetical protein